jgi:hypothetical protein
MQDDYGQSGIKVTSGSATAIASYVKAEHTYIIDY